MNASHGLGRTQHIRDLSLSTVPAGVIKWPSDGAFARLQPYTFPSTCSHVNHISSSPLDSSLLISTTKLNTCITCHAGTGLSLARVQEAASDQAPSNSSSQLRTQLRVFESWSQSRTSSFASKRSFEPRSTKKSRPRK